MRVANAVVVIISWLWDRSSAIVGAGKSIAKGVYTTLQYAAKWLYEKASFFKQYKIRRTAFMCIDTE